ncbi:MAG: hypothetical protein JOY54_18320 [Acidobacteriaceae bacterium]|nr:hypothetical protein [Acidobacteriaceae bacterium]
MTIERWLREGTEPPGSRFPRITRDELTPLSALEFPHIPGISICNHKREAYRLDFAMEPPQAGPAFPTLVPRVGSDGNELGGIRMPEVAVALATYTGWNLRNADIGAPSEPLAFTGSWLPFSRTKQIPVAADDPRPSIAERYANEQDYLARIDAAARELATEGFLLEKDLDLLHERAAQEWEYRQQLK